MGYTRQLGQLAYLITYDGSGNITVPASLTQGSVTSSMLKADGSGKLVAAVAGTDFVAPAGLSAYVPTTRTITINGTAYDLSADRSWTIVSGVSSFNTRTGAITLLDTDVTGALGYTPVTNARTITINGTTYDLSANRSWSIVAGISSFNTRTGDITLLDTDVTGALGYTPVTNARTITINGTTYDLSANRTWVVDTSSVTTRVIQKFTATSSQTTFTITGGYTVGMVDVFLNGIKLDNAVDFTATDSSTVVLAIGAATGDIVEVYKYGGQFIANNTLRQSTLFTATAGQTTFTVNYSVGFVDVFYNGSKLDSSEFTATNGTSIVLGTACVLNDKVEVVAYNYTVGAFTGVGGSGTTNYISKWTASGTLGNSLIFDNGTNVGIGTSSPATYTIAPQLVVDSGASGGGLTIKTGTTSSTTNYGGVFFADGTTGSEQYRGFIQYNHNFNSLSDTLILGTAGTEKMYITSSGNVGIGTSSPTSTANYATLTVGGASGVNGQVTWNSGSTAVGYAYNDATNMNFGSNASLIFQTTSSATERMRITPAGNILMGTTTSDVGRLQVQASGGGSSYGFSLLLMDNSASKNALLISHRDGDTRLLSTYGGTGINCDMSFWTTLSNGSQSEKMRLTSGGALAIGTSTVAYSNYKFLAKVASDRNLAIGNQGSDVSIEAYNDAVTANVPLRIYGNNISLLGGAVLKPANPAFRAYNSVNGFWYVPNNDTLVFDLTEYNIGSHYNTSNGRFTAPVAGVYQFNFYTIVYSNINNGAISIRKNGGAPTSGHNIHFSPTNTGGTWSNVVYTTSLYLNAGDYIYLINSTGAQLTIHGDDWSSFSGYLVG